MTAREILESRTRDGRKRLAREAADMLLTRYHGEAKSRAREKYSDALFLVNGDADFWRLVLDDLEARP